MRLTNLYNYAGVHTFSTKNHINLDCVPVISNTGYDEEPQKEFLQYRIFDSVKENRAYLDLLKKCDLSDLTFEELVEVTIQSQIEEDSILSTSLNSEEARLTKLSIKVSYILLRIESYWPNNVDKCLVIYKRLFIGQSNEKVGNDFRIWINDIKSLMLDYKNLWRLYKAYLASHKSMRKLKLEHFEFISQFLI